MSNPIVAGTLMKSWNSMFYESAQEVLETMFFSSVFGPAEPLYAHSADSQEQIVTAELSFTGTPSGRIQVSLTEIAAGSIAANFLGKDAPEQVSSHEIEQVVGELANMVCGSALSRMDSHAVFSLSHPQIKPIEKPLRQDTSVIASFELADGVMTAQIVFDSPQTMASANDKE